MTIVAQPKNTTLLIGANNAVQNTAHVVLFVGQKTSAGSATSGALIENVLTNAEDDLFGENSMLAGMIRTARAQNEIGKFDAIGLDDNGTGTAATIVVTFTGTATEAGTITVNVGSEKDYSYDIAISNGDTADDIGAALASAIGADTKVPFTAANVTGTVTLTAVNAGTVANSIGIAAEGSVAGVTVALTAATGGANDPSFTGVFDVVGDNRYQGIVWPWFDDTSELRSFLDDRFNVDNKLLDGVGVTSSVDTLANHLSRLTPLNSQSLVDFADKTTDEALFKGPAQFELSYVKASQFAAIRALRLTDGASISDYVSATNGLLDAFGGSALASKPYFNTSAPDLPLTQTGRGWTETEIEQLKDAGGSVIGNNRANNQAVFGETVTTYKTDVSGSADESFTFLNYVDTGSNIREYYFNNLIARFQQSRLVEGDVIRGRDEANAQVIRAFCEKLYQDLSGPDFVLVEAGEDAKRFYKENLNVTIDKSTGRATVTMIVQIVTQLREILTTIKISF